MITATKLYGMGWKMFSPAAHALILEHLNKQAELDEEARLDKAA